MDSRVVLPAQQGACFSLCLCPSPHSCSFSLSQIKNLSKKYRIFLDAPTESMTQQQQVRSSRHMLTLPKHLPYARYHAKFFTNTTYLILATILLGRCYYFPILQMRRPRHRVVKESA